MGEVYEASVPELPEVETIRRRLESQLAGSRAESASLHRRDMLRTREPRRGRSHRGEAKGSRARWDDSALRRSMLEGGIVRSLHRRGKQLALETMDGRVLLVHLGMSGRLLLAPDLDGGTSSEIPPHTHASWRFHSAGGRHRLLFVDPRRFGWMQPFESSEALRRRWSHLGVDAIDLTGEGLRAALDRSCRAIKSLMLDQSVVAGLGNIYVDESLHRVGLHPLTPARAAVDRADELAVNIRGVLQAAIELGGSTIRDYRDPSGDFGSFQRHHAVYGRDGERCRRCAAAGRDDALVVRTLIGGRGTWFCPRCQPPPVRLGKSRLSTGHRQRASQ